MLTLDGATLEGGGQLVRVALALSAICNIPVHIHGIRANRARKGQPRQNRGRSGRGTKSEPSRGSNFKADGGLKESHLAALVWLATQCDADVEGAAVGSREVTFVPHGLRKGSKTPAFKTNSNNGNTIELLNPGSVWLIFQALFPFMVFGLNPDVNNAEQPRDSQDTLLELTLKGGTNVSKSMSAEYVQQVFLPTCQRIGLPPTSIEVLKRGWASGAPAIGEVRIRIPKPTQAYSLPAFNMTERGTITSVSISIVAEPESTRSKMIALLSELIPLQLDLATDEVSIDVPVNDSSGDPRRLYVLLVAHTSNGYHLGRDFLGSGRLPKTAAEANKITENACQTVLRELAQEIRKGGCVDEHMQDQLVIFQALAEGVSRVDGGTSQKSREVVKQREDEENGDYDKDADEVGDEEGSLHTRTVRWVVEKMLRKQNVKFEKGGFCKGAG